MDKETLSNYGWIVICVLVMVVMIALATPFGSFISEAVQSTTQGLFDVNQSALNSTGLITVDDQEFDVPDMNHGAENGGAGQTPVEPETPAVALVTFTINDLTNKVYALQYQAEEGMTWAQWLASEYNKDAYVFESTSIYLDSGNNTQTLLTSGGHYDEITITANSTYQIINPKSTNVESETPVEPSPCTHTTLKGTCSDCGAITFSIRNMSTGEVMSYQMDEGMTWADWMNSPYCTESMICVEPTYGYVYWGTPTDDWDTTLVNKIYNGVQFYSSTSAIDPSLDYTIGIND